MRRGRLTCFYKMVFIDLDGTTLTTDKRITPRTKHVLETLDASGIPVVITTGRSIYSVRNFFGQLGLESPVISLNGTVVYQHIKGQLQSYKHIEDSLLKELFDLFQKRDEIDNFMFEGLNDYYVLQSDRELRKSFIEIRKKPPLIVESQYCFNEPITNLLVRPREKKDEIHQWLLEHTSGRMHFVNTEWNWIEGINPGVNKGTAIKEMAESYGVTLDQVVAFGDEWNDLEMLEVAGLGVAMENGSNEAKEVADRIAPSNDHEGVAHILEELFSETLAQNMRTKR